MYNPHDKDLTDRYTQIHTHGCMHGCGDNLHSLRVEGSDGMLAKCGAPSTTRSLTERVHVWTSLALGSNNCILDVSKEGILPVLC